MTTKDYSNKQELNELVSDHNKAVRIMRELGIEEPENDEEEEMKYETTALNYRPVQLVEELMW